MLDKLIEAGEQEIQVIAFKLGTEEYAVPITNVQEIILIQDQTRIPESPDFITGVINLRGQIIPVIDGKKKFMISEDSENSVDADNRIMILELEEETVGLIVDSVSEVVHQQVSEIEPPPIEASSDSNFIWGVGKFHDRLLILLNPEDLLSTDSKVNLEQLASVSKTVKQLNNE